MLALAAEEEAADFRTKAKDIKDAMEEANLADVEDADLSVAMGEAETIGAVDNIIEWCDAMTDHNWGCTRHMTSLTMNGTGCLRQK